MSRYQIEEVELEEQFSNELAFVSLSSDSHIRVTEPFGPLNGQEQHLSVSGQVDALAVAHSNEIRIGKLSGLRALLCSQDKGAEVGYTPDFILPAGNATKISFTCDGRSLVAAVDGSKLLKYEFDRIGANDSSPALEIPAGDISTFEVNPANPELVSVLTNTGALGIVSLTSGGAANKIADNVTSMTWSKRGKQLIAGRTDGSLTQFNPAGEVTDEIPTAPSLNGYCAYAISWLENHTFVVVYNSLEAMKSESLEESHAYESYVLTREAAKKITYAKLSDPTPPFGYTNVRGSYSFYPIKSWKPDLQDLVVFAASCSTDIGCVVRHSSTGKWVTSSIENETSRASLPYSKIADQDTFLVGSSLDVFSDEGIPNPLGEGAEPTRSSPLPILWLLNSDGLLTAYHVMYVEGVKTQQSPSEMAAVSVGAAPPHKSSDKSPVPADATTPSQTASFGVSQASARPPSFGGSTGTKVPAFAQASMSGNTSESKFGETNSPSAFRFGQDTSQPQATTFGSQQPMASNSGQPAFGQSSFDQTAFGQTAFGQPSFGQASFGQSSFGQQTSSTQPAFGQSAFGQSAFGQFSSGQPSFGQFGTRPTSTAPSDSMAQDPSRPLSRAEPPTWGSAFDTRSDTQPKQEDEGSSIGSDDRADDLFDGDQLEPQAPQNSNPFAEQAMMRLRENEAGGLNKSPKPNAGPFSSLSPQSQTFNNERQNPPALFNCSSEKEASTIGQKSGRSSPKVRPEISRGGDGTPAHGYSTSPSPIQRADEAHDAATPPSPHQSTERPPMPPSPGQTANEPPMPPSPRRLAEAPEELNMPPSPQQTSEVVEQAPLPPPPSQDAGPTSTKSSVSSSQSWDVIPSSSEKGDIEHSTFQRDAQGSDRLEATSQHCDSEEHGFTDQSDVESSQAEDTFEASLQSVSDNEGSEQQDSEPPREAKAESPPRKVKPVLQKPLAPWQYEIERPKSETLQEQLSLMIKQFESELALTLLNLESIEAFVAGQIRTDDSDSELLITDAFAMQQKLESKLEPSKSSLEDSRELYRTLSKRSKELVNLETRSVQIARYIRARSADNPSNLPMRRLRPEQSTAKKALRAALLATESKLEEYGRFCISQDMKSRGTAGVSFSTIQENVFRIAHKISQKSNDLNIIEQRLRALGLSNNSNQDLSLASLRTSREKSESFFMNNAGSALFDAGRVNEQQNFMHKLQSRMKTFQVISTSIEILRRCILSELLGNSPAQ